MLDRADTHSQREKHTHYGPVLLSVSASTKHFFFKEKTTLNNLLFSKRPVVKTLKWLNYVVSKTCYSKWNLSFLLSNSLICISKSLYSTVVQAFHFWCTDDYTRLGYSSGLAFSISDKSCLYPFSVSINNQLLAIWFIKSASSGPCLVFSVMPSRVQPFSAHFLSSAAVIIHTHCTPARGCRYVCVLRTCDHWRVVWAVSCTVQERPVSWQQPPPVHPGKAGGMRGRERVNDDGFMVINSSWDLKGEAARVVEQA